MSRRYSGQAVVAFLRRDVLAAVAALALGGIVWEIVAGPLHAAWLPTFSSVLGRTGELFGDPQFRQAILDSVRDVIVGYAVAVVLGIAAGTAMGLSRHADAALKYYLDLALFVPPIIMAPVFLIVFGLSSATLLAIIVVFSASVIAVNTRAAVAGTDAMLRDVAQVFGASRRQEILRVVLPGATPLIFVGLHLGIARAVKGMIIGQLFLAVVGVGAFEARFQQAFDAAGIWSIALVVVAVSLLLGWVVKFVDGVVNYWAYGGLSGEQL